MVADYTENFLVGRILGFPGDSAPAALIGQASMATMVKSLTGGLALTALLIALIAAGVRRFSRR